jgi:hypothetical protein
MWTYFLCHLYDQKPKRTLLFLKGQSAPIRISLNWYGEDALITSWTDMGLFFIYFYI